MNKTSTVIAKPTYFFHVALLGIFVVAALWLIGVLLSDGLYPLASALGAIVIFLSMVYLQPRFTPLRWMAIGITLALIFTLYPLLYTLYLSVTNMGSGHLMSKQQAISRLAAMTYLAEDSPSYGWTAFQAPDGS